MKSSIWTPAPISVCGPALFSSNEIEAYERDILSNPKATEHDASHFFRTFPKFLHLGTGAEVRREVVLLKTQERVDFFRRSYGETYWDIVELKHPHKPVVVGVNSLHPRLSADVDKAISQALDYRDLIDSDGEVKKDLKMRGLSVCRPQITVVVGQSREDVDPETLRILYARIRDRGGIEAKSYTDLYNFAKENYSRSKVIIIPSMHFSEDPEVFPDTATMELIERVAANPDFLRELHPRDFEMLVAHLLKSMGLMVKVTASSRDGGVDIVALQDDIGTSKFLIQCKRYSAGRKIEVSTVREMHGLVTLENATKGFIVATSEFSRSANEYLQEHKYLIEGIGFQRLMTWIDEYQRRQRGALL